MNPRKSNDLVSVGVLIAALVAIFTLYERHRLVPAVVARTMQKLRPQIVELLDARDAGR